MDTKTKALSLGRHYLQTLGFNGFSFQTVADALGIRKASLHYYFASKEEMGLAILEDYQKAYATWAQNIHGLPADKKMEQMLQMFYKIGKDHNKVCPLGALCSDFNTLSEKIQDRLREFHLQQRKWLIATIKEGMKDKIFRQDLNPPIVADTFLAAIQGGLQVARIRGEAETFKSMVKNLVKELS
ncbi:MAG: TetR family transcriptional regulator [Bdellovibrio sp. ArHS]|uniref:TetR/AcrR family transcriptional regulator n=1 Tax=Bdellovibrio sp. ArHS TaxID=1569284 RepID=UPI0005832119|nr:TetR/AcrR family transcriptional regulator [Bdellovibrio sp. ArHS]KHD88751.1 MAG: TetR family transcriptional regulator [Bdellovibrio sp. ArHS]